MKRKLIKQGLGGVTISLPIKWVRERNLKTGDEISLEEHEGSLILSGSERGFRKASIKIETVNRSLLRTIIASYYRMGYYELELQFSQDVPLHMLSDVVDSLIGYELITQSKRSFLIRNIMAEEQEEAMSLVNKLFQATKLLLTMKLEHASTSDTESMRKSILRLRDYAKRKTILESKKHAYELYELILVVEKIAGEYFYLNTKKINKQSLTVIEKHHALFNELHTCFLKNKFTIANKLYLALSEQVKRDQSENTYWKYIKKENCSPEIAFSCSRILHLLFTASSRLNILSS